jgi:hypothetical protein
MQERALRRPSFFMVACRCRALGDSRLAGLKHRIGRISERLNQRLYGSLPLQIGAEIIGISLKAPMDERLARIEVARSSLADALSAIDDLKFEAEANREALETVNAKIADARDEHRFADKELRDVQALAAIDAQNVRKTLRMTSRNIWADRLLSFLIGVAASVVATWVWVSFFQ